MTPRTLAGADRARRRAAVARTPGLRALERAEARLEESGLLRVLLHFVPDAAGGPGVPAEVSPANLRVMGPRGPLAVVSVAPTAGDPATLTALAVPPAGASTHGAYAVSVTGVPSMDPLLSHAPFQLGGQEPLLNLGPPPGGGEDAPVQHQAPVDLVPLPAAGIDYLSKDYATFRALMLDRMAVTLPTWTERNPADIGVMLVEVLAYAGDYLSYYQDAAATEAYLGTSRLRTSLARHARLLDYAVNQGCSAVAWVQVSVCEAGLTLPVGTRFYTRTAQDVAVLVPGTAQAAGALREHPLAFESMEAITPDPNLNQVSIYTWGAEQYVLPAGAISATLVDAYVAGKRALDGLRPGDVLVLQEQRAAGGGAPDPSHRQAVRLTWVKRNLDPAGGRLSGGSGGAVPVVEIGWHDADALQFPLTVSGTDHGAPYTGGAVALGNLVLADHGETAGPFDLPVVPPLDLYRPWVPVPFVSRRPPFDARRAAGAAASSASVRDPGKALAEVWLKDGEGRRWSSRADLLGSTPFSREFVVEADEEGASRIRFGDGQLGMAPPPGTRFRMKCRTGLGLAGNVGRDVLSHVLTPVGDALTTQRMVSGILQVRNPIPSASGADPEPAYRVRTRAPQAYQVQARGVTPDDWVALTQALPQVRRASAVAAWQGTSPQDRIWVQRQQGFPEDEAFLAGLRRALETYRPAGRGLRVLPPSYVGIDVGLTVRLHAQALRSAVEQQLRAALLASPGGVFAPARYTFAEAVWLSQVVAAAAGVDGVVWVQPTRFARWSPYGDATVVPDELPMGAHEVAVLKNLGDQPWYGTLSLSLQGGIG